MIHSLWSKSLVNQLSNLWNHELVQHRGFHILHWELHMMYTSQQNRIQNKICQFVRKMSMLHFWKRIKPVRKQSPVFWDDLRYFETCQVSSPSVLEVRFLKITGLLPDAYGKFVHIEQNYRFHRPIDNLKDTKTRCDIPTVIVWNIIKGQSFSSFKFLISNSEVINFRSFIWCHER